MAGEGATDIEFEPARVSQDPDGIRVSSWMIDFMRRRLAG